MKDRFKQVVARTPPERLERLFASPLRMPILRLMFALVPRVFNPKRAGAVRAVVEFRLTRADAKPADRFHVAIADGKATSGPARDVKPTVVLELSGPDFLRLAAGAASAPALLFGGKIQLRGDAMIAASLGAMFSPA